MSCPLMGKAWELVRLRSGPEATGKETNSNHLPLKPANAC